MSKQSNAINQYCRGASSALQMLIKIALEKNMPPDEAMSLAVCFGNTIEVMRKKNDRLPPFLSRAMAKALEKMGIEGYETALQRITSAPTFRLRGEVVQVMAKPADQSQGESTATAQKEPTK